MILRHTSTILTLTACGFFLVAGCTNDPDSGPTTTAIPASTDAHAGQVKPSQTKTDDADTTDSTSTDEPVVIADAPLEPWQIELLELSYDAASKFPLNPHIKNRSRTQDVVVDACFELNQPKRALRYAEGIVNWHKGMGYADYAYYVAQRGAMDEVQMYLDKAEAIALTAEDWRRDTIRVRIAETHLLMGDAQAAERFETGLVDSEKGKTDALRASLLADDEFDAYMAKLELVTVQMNVDATRNAMFAYIELYKTFYENAERRDRIERDVKRAWDTLQKLIRLQVLLELATVAHDHTDAAKATQLIDEAQSLFDEVDWTLEHHLKYLAPIAELRFQIGDTARAHADIEAALARYEDEKDTMPTSFHAGALRPLAEAYVAAGDREKILAMYTMTLEAGILNKNNRPRCVDLVATCCSMAVHGIEPTEAMLARMHAINEGLDELW